MSWIVLLLAAWILVDVLIVAAFSVLTRRRTEQRRPATMPVRAPQVSARTSSRLVH